MCILNILSYLDKDHNVKNIVSCYFKTNYAIENITFFDLV